MHCFVFLLPVTEEELPRQVSPLYNEYDVTNATNRAQLQHTQGPKTSLYNPAQ